MATETRSPITPSTQPARRSVGPGHHGLAMDYREFTEADFEEGWLYELAKGIVDVTEVAGPEHGDVVDRIVVLFVLYRVAHRGVIQFRAGGAECRLRLPGMKSDRHPDQAIYLRPRPPGPRVWERWI